MTNIIYQPIPDDASFSSASPDHNNIHTPSASSSSHQAQSEILVKSQLNIHSLSLYSVIGKACFACTRSSSSSPELLNDDDNTTIAPSCSTNTTTVTTRQYRKGATNTGMHVSSNFSRKLSPSLKIFSYEELNIATSYFNQRNKKYEDRYGTVFKGFLDDQKLTPTKPGKGIVFAVKRVYQGVNTTKIWLGQARLNFLAQLNHPNLVRLVGYCSLEELRLLVYEFMPFGSLEDHLFKEGSQPLPWSHRMNVALGAAKGLAFLHNAEIVHGDFKPSNILLDSGYNARLSDFGLAKDSPPARCVEGIHGDVQIGIDCLNGYTAPECRDSGDLTATSDVCSFGVVLLEMLFSGRIVDKYQSIGGEHIERHWAKRCLNNKNRLFDVLSSSFDCEVGEYTLEGLQKAATIAFKCLSMQANSRPNMCEVVTALDRI